MTGLFVQIRLDSSRLPRKALLPLSGTTVTDHVLAALQGIPADIRAVVTERESVAELAPIAGNRGFEVYVGPKDDVLARFAGAAARYGVDTVVRATGDNPLVSAELGTEILRLHCEKTADYSGFLEIPVGAGVEILNAEALFIAHREAQDPYEREHVSPFLYRRPERFRINRPYPQDAYRLPDARITLDTLDDYNRILKIFTDLYHGEPVPIGTLIQRFRENPAYPGV